jgi:hypothetical protein
MRPLFITKFAGPAVVVSMKKQETQGAEDGSDFAGIGGLMATAVRYRGVAGSGVG